MSIISFKGPNEGSMPAFLDKSMAAILRYVMLSQITIILLYQIIFEVTWMMQFQKVEPSKPKLLPAFDQFFCQECKYKR